MPLPRLKKNTKALRKPQRFYDQSPICETLAFFYIILYNMLRPICAGRVQRYFHAHSAR